MSGSSKGGLDPLETTKEIEEFITKSLQYHKSEFKKRLLRKGKLGRASPQPKTGGRFIEEDILKECGSEIKVIFETVSY